MLAIEDDFSGTGSTPEQYLEPFRQSHPTARLDIACYNGPDNCVVAGSTADIDLLEEYLRERKRSSPRLRFKVLRGMHAYHFVMADPIVDASAELSASTPFQVRTYSKAQPTRYCWPEGAEHDVTFGAQKVI
jgi:malonyl CoA-acyl carrier protein transacylase